MKTHIASALAACGLFASHASAVITYEDSFDDGSPVTNNFNGHFAPNYAIPLTESGGSLLYGASNLASNWSNVNVNTSETFQLPTVGQQTSIEWQIGPMTVTVVGDQGYGDIRQQLSIVSANINKANFQQDAYGFDGATGAFLGTEINYKQGENPFANLLFKNNGSAPNAGAPGVPDQSGHQFDPAASNTFRLVLNNVGGAITVTFFVNGTLTATAPLADIAPNGEFNGGFFISNRAQSLNTGRGTLSLARLSVDESNGVTPLPPRLASVFNFDSDLQGFTRWADEQPLQDPSHTTEYGGALKILVHPGEGYLWRTANIRNFSGQSLARLKSAAVNGGTFSFDIIGEAGSLANLQIGRSVQPTGAFRWNDNYTNISPDSVRVLPDGKEIARFSYSLRSLVNNRLRPFVTNEDNYSTVFGFSGAGAADRNYYFDNLMINPYSATDRAKLDFASNTLPFTALNGATIQPSTVDSKSLAFTCAGTYASYLSADFSSTSGDANVVAINAKLQAASRKGGYLQFTLKEPSVANPTAGFTYMEPLIIHAGKAVLGSGLPVASFDSGVTPTDFQRIITVPLYPSSSLRTDGFLLAANQNSYVIELGVNSAGIDSTTWNIDDFEIIVNDTTQVVSAPLLPAGGGPVFGHVVSNNDGSAAYSATGLPAGVTIDPATGMVTGTPTFNGTYNVVFTASVDGVADSTTSAKWVVSNATNPGNTIPSITSFSYNGDNSIVTWTGTGTSPVDVQRSTTLETTGWTTISTGNTAGTYTDIAPPAGGKAFYRVLKP